ncbi:MAG: DUF6790 family protein, partial [Gemmatimonadota bacterium]
VRRVGELLLVYVLVGYCGIPMVGVSVATLAAPERVAEILGFPAGNPFQAFMGVAYLALSVLAVLTLRYRGRFLIAPAVGWAIFFAGATVIHVRHEIAGGTLTHGGVLAVFATHGLISVLLVGGLVVSGLLWERS